MAELDKGRLGRTHTVLLGLVIGTRTAPLVMSVLPWCGIWVVWPCAVALLAAAVSDD